MARNSQLARVRKSFRGLCSLSYTVWVAASVVAVCTTGARSLESCPNGVPAQLLVGGAFTVPVGLLVHSSTDRESLQTIEAVKVALEEVNNAQAAMQRVEGGIEWRVNVTVSATQWQRYNALEASLSLIHNDYIMAILGMAASTTVSVVGPVAGSVGIPAIATAVTDRDTHTSFYYPTFMRACSSDINLPLALRDLVLHYVWHTVGLIYSVAFSGYHAVNDVVDKAPIFGVNVVQSVYVEFDGTDFDGTTGQKTNLSASTLDGMDAIVRSSVKIIVLNVHGSELLAILRRAKKLGMLEKGYAWIVLQFFSSPTLLPAEVLDLLNGAVLLRPQVNDLKAAHLAQTLYQRAPSVCPSAHPSSLSLEAVYAYDAAVAFARGVSQWINSSGLPTLGGCVQTAPSLSQSVSLSRWNKMSELVGNLRAAPPLSGAGGMLNLGNDYALTNYDVLNLVNSKVVLVGSWTATKGLDLDNVDTLKQRILWTGGTYEVPSTHGFLNQHLLIYVPLSNPFTFLLRDPPLRNEDFSGVAVDLLRSLANASDFNYTLRLWRGSWTDMVQIVGNASTPYDMAVGSITVNSARAKMCTFSKSIFLSGLRILVKRPPETSFGFWSFFLPFHWTVWLVLFLFLLVSGYVLSLLDPEGVTTQRQGIILVDGIFFSLMSFFFVHEADEIKKPWARIYMGSLQFCMLVLVTSYTANMATFLTGKSGVHITGYSDLYQKPVACRNGTANWIYVTEQLGLRHVVPVKGPSEALAKLRSGEVVAYIGDSPHIRGISARECDVITLGTQVDSQQYAFAFKQGSPWQLEINRVLGLLITRGKVTELFNQYVPRQCKPYVTDNGVQSMTLANLGGLFVLLAITSVATLSTKLHRVLYVRRRQIKKMGSSEGYAEEWAGSPTSFPMTTQSPWVLPYSLPNTTEPLLGADMPDSISHLQHSNGAAGLAMESKDRFRAVSFPQEEEDEL